jgi:hypothetical protein
MPGGGAFAGRNSGRQDGWLDDMTEATKTFDPEFDRV